MTLDEKIINELAARLEDCELQVKDTHKVTDDHPNMDWRDAYAIQNAIKARKLARGGKVVGYKAGLTSHAKMRQMGVDVPCFGFLVDSFAVPERGDIAFDKLIHPKVEPEICFVTKKALRGPGCNVAAVLAATDFILPGIEVIDSRYRDFKFDLKSVIADNCSAARFVLGGAMRPPEDLHLPTLGVVLEVNGQAAAVAAGAAVLGHPASAVVMLVNHLAEWGQELPAGSLVLSGGVTEAIQVKRGDAVNLRMQHLDSVGCRFV